MKRTITFLLIASMLFSCKKNTEVLIKAKPTGVENVSYIEVPRIGTDIVDVTLRHPSFPDGHIAVRKTIVNGTLVTSIATTSGLCVELAVATCQNDPICRILCRGEAWIGCLAGWWYKCHFG